MRIPEVEATLFIEEGGCKIELKIYSILRNYKYGIFVFLLKIYSILRNKMNLTNIKRI